MFSAGTRFTEASVAITFSATGSDIPHLTSADGINPPRANFFSRRARIQKWSLYIQTVSYAKEEIKF
jgi:hypothetical protein